MNYQSISGAMRSVVLLFGATAAVSAVVLWAAPPEITPSPAVLVDDDPAVLMRGKLTRSKEILEGLIRNDFRSISRAATELKRISEVAAWSRPNDPIYHHFSVEFRRQCNELAVHARELNHDGVKFTYLSMTMTCVNCHKHVRDLTRVANSSNDGAIRYVR